LLPTPAARDHKGKSLENREGGNALPDVTDWGKYALAIERWVEVMDRPAPDPTDGQGRLNPALVEWMMGYPEGWVDGVSRTGQLKALGNAIVPHQAAAAWGHLLGLDVDADRQAEASTTLLPRRPGPRTPTAPQCQYPGQFSECS